MPFALGAGAPAPINIFPVIATGTTSPTCVSWFRSDLGVTTDSSNNVSEWVDQLGLANSQTLTQATPGNRPGYKTTGGLNGCPYIDFSTIGGYFLSSSQTLNLGNPYEVFMVVQYTTSDSTAWLIDLTNSGAGYPAIRMGTATEIGQRTSTSFINQVTVATGNSYLIDCLFSTTSAFSYVSTTTNSTTASSGGGGNVPAGGTGIVVGNGAGSIQFGGKIYELAFYNGSVGSTVRSAWKSYVTTRYGFTA